MGLFEGEGRANSVAGWKARGMAKGMYIELLSRRRVAKGGVKVIQTGHTGLMKAIIDMGARTPRGKELVLECQGSSIGTYSTQWVNEFYWSARGESAQTWLEDSRAKRAKLPYPPVKILFPSKRTVQESALGEQVRGASVGGVCAADGQGRAAGRCSAGGRSGRARSSRGSSSTTREASAGACSCTRRYVLPSADLYRPALRHLPPACRSRAHVRRRQMIVGTFRDTGLAAASSRALQRFDTPSDAGTDEDVVEVRAPRRDDDLVGWAYVGSHNFTPSAWGTLSGSGFNPTLNVRVSPAAVCAR